MRQNRHDIAKADQSAMADSDVNPKKGQRQASTTKVIMTATPKHVFGGETVTVTWGVTEGNADVLDWIGLFREDDDDSHPIKSCYVKGNRRGGEWSVAAPKECGRYVFRFIKSLFPYDAINKNYLVLQRSNAWEVLQASSRDGVAASSGDLHSSSDSALPSSSHSPSSLNPDGLGGPSGWISFSPRHAIGSGHHRAAVAAWLRKHLAGDAGEVSSVSLEEAVALSYSCEDWLQARDLSHRLAAAADQPGYSRRLVVEAGGVGALLHLMKRWDASTQLLCLKALSRLMTFVPPLFGGMHDLNKRVLSFGADWPHGDRLSPACMAEAGFYSLPLEPGSDRVVCFSCSLVLESWEHDEPPEQLHQALSPLCPFLSWPNKVSADAHRARLHLNHSKSMNDLLPEQLEVPSMAGAYPSSPAGSDEAGGVGVLEMKSKSSAMEVLRASVASVSRMILESAEAEEALSAVASSADRGVLRSFLLFVADLACVTGRHPHFAALCLPKILVGMQSKDEECLLHICEALRHLVLQPPCRKLLHTEEGMETVNLLINFLPKWSARSREQGRQGVGVWQTLLQHALVVLEFTLRWAVQEGGVCDAESSIFCVLRDALPEQIDVQRAALGCLITLAECGDAPAPYMESHKDLEKLVIMSVRGGDLNIRTRTARVLAAQCSRCPQAYLEIAQIGLHDSDGDGTEGIAAMLWLARDTRSQGANGADVVSQRFVAHIIERMAFAAKFDDNLLNSLLKLGVEEQHAREAYYYGGRTLECALSWLAGARSAGEPLPPPDLSIDFPKLFVSRGGLECIAEMMQEKVTEIQHLLWQALYFLTLDVSSCFHILRSKIGYEWILPRVAGWEPKVCSEGFLRVLANLCVDAETCSSLTSHGVVSMYASVVASLSSRDAARANACAKGLYHVVLHAQFHTGEQLDAWWPADSDLGGAAALLKLCSFHKEVATQRWTAMALYNLTQKATGQGLDALVEYIIAQKGVQSLLFLVYSDNPEVSSYAMSTIAVLSKAVAPVFPGPGENPSHAPARRALFMAGVMWCVHKLWRDGNFDMQLAIAVIVCNLGSNQENLMDMMSGSDELLEILFYFIALCSDPVRVEQAAVARKDGNLLSSISKVQAAMEMKLSCVVLLGKILSFEEYHARFLSLGGLGVWTELAKTEGEPAMAILIAQGIEALARDASITRVLNDNGIKQVGKDLLRRHDDRDIDAAVERVLVLLSESREVRGDHAESEERAHALEQVGWRITCFRRSTNEEDEEEETWKFRMEEAFNFDELLSRIRQKFGSSLLLTYQDEDEDWKVLSCSRELHQALSLAKRRGRKELSITVVTPPKMLSEGDAGRAEDKEVNQEVNPWLSTSSDRTDTAGGQRVTPNKTVTISKLCDSSPNFSGSDKKLLRWRLGRQIGEGAYAQVYQGINADSGELMAVKQIFFSEVSFQDNKKKRNEAIKALQREIDVMKMLQHENIVKYLGTETDEGRLNIFLEYVSGGSIASLIANFGALDEPVVRKYTRQILVGLEFLHSKGVVHCDIKGGNILVTEDGIIKLADFNSSKYLDSITGGGSNPLKSLLGTPQFMAPEVIRQTGHGKKADIWSVGCTVIQMLTGAPPWDEISNKVTLMFHIATAPNGPPLPDDLHDDARDFLGKTFKLDARERPHCSELLRSRFVSELEAADVRAPNMAAPQEGGASSTGAAAVNLPLDSS